MTHFVRPIVGCVVLLLAVNTAGAGDASPLTATLRVLQSSPVSAPVANRASTVAPKPAEANVVSAVPQVRVSTAGPETLVVNEPAKYVISLDNLGSRAASKIKVRCELPAWVELGEHVASLGKLVETQPMVVWQVDHIAGQAHEELTLNLIPREGKAFDLKVDVSVEPANVNVQKRIAVQQPKLDLQLAGPEAVSFGETSAWKLRVRNPGTGDLGNVSVDVFSGDTKLASHTLASIAAGGEQPISLQINPTQVGAHSVRVIGKSGKLSDSAEASFLVRRGRLAVDLVGAPQSFAGASSR